MEIQTVRIDSLIPDPSNARKHSPKNLAAIKGSLAKFGQQKNIVIDKNNVVVAGNGTLEAAKALGWTEIVAARTELSGPEAIAFALADNRSGELAEWDLDVLGSALESLSEDDFDLSAIGFDDKDLSKFIPEQIKEGLIDDDEIPEVTETRCKPGDLWQLGEHRLLCGDSTNIQHVERLMGGEKADMVFTDPPYGMKLDTDFSGALGALGRKNNTQGNKYKPVIGDNEDFTPDLINTIFTAFNYCKEMFLFGADYYAELLPDKNSGSWLVWDKRKESQSEAIGSEFELCWSKGKHKRRMLRHDWFGFLSSKNSSEARNRVHPTQKPTSLIVDVMEQWGNAEDLVADIYLGSGSTLIACEKTNRRCFGMEIDPHYCSVILARWEKFTGKTATLVSA